MSKNTKSLEPGAVQPQRFSRPFDAVVIALSSALLIIFGVVIGRFVVTKQAVAVVDHFDSEVASLQAEIVELNRQIVQSQARCIALEESSERYRQLAQQHQIRAETFAGRQQALRSTLASLSERRTACLDQVQQYVALDQPIPSLDVLRFAEAMFAMQSHTIEQLAVNSNSTSALPTVPEFPPVAATTLTAQPAMEPPAFPRRPAQKVDSVRAAHDEPARAGRGFFAPPSQQRVAGSIFFAARRDPQALSMPKKSGITFHDTATGEDATVRR